MTRADIIVVGASPAEGERFALLRRDAFADVMFAESLPWRPFEEWQQAFERFCRQLQWVTEDDVRVQLVEMGLSADQVHRQLHRARSACWRSGPTQLPRESWTRWRSGSRTRGSSSRNTE